MSLGHFRYSTPTAGLKVIYNIMPLNLLIRYEATAAYVRTQGCNIISEGNMFS